MPVQYIGGGGNTFVNPPAASVTRAMPSGLLAGDLLLAWVFSFPATASEPVATPTGWTLVGAAKAFAAQPAYTTVTVFRKNTVSPSDSGVNQTFALTGGGNTVWVVTYAQLRGSVTTPVVVQTGISIKENMGDNYIYPTMMVGARNGEMYMTAAGFNNGFNNSSPMYPYGTTLISGTVTLSLWGVAYQALDMDMQSTDDYWNFNTSGTAGSALACFSVRLRDPGVAQTVSEAMGFADVAADHNVHPVALTERLGVSEMTRLAPLMSITDVINFALTNSEVMFAITLKDTLNFGSTLSVTPRWGETVRETVNLIESMSAKGKYAVTANDAIKLVEKITTARSVKLTDVLNIASTLKIAQVVTLLNHLGLKDIVSASAKYHKGFADGIVFRDDVQRFLGLSVTDHLGFHDTRTTSRIFHPTITDVVNLHDTLTRRIVIKLSVNDKFTLDDNLTTKMIYNAILTDGIEFEAALVDPNGGITTWAINTKTGATSEYLNWRFNSFAKRGSKYIAASSAGLYELNGDTDDDVAIIADIQTGIAQFVGSRLAGVKALYLGLRGTGDMILRIHTIDDDKVRDYKVVFESMRTARVNVGKGIRARYFTFELITTGQDFDLETIEMMPLPMVRRV